MIENKNLFKRAVLITSFICISIILSVIISSRIFIQRRDEYYLNRVRILVSSQMNMIDKGIYTKGNYPFIIFDLEGRVIYSDKEEEYKIGNTYNLSEVLEFDKSYYNGDSKNIKHSFIIKENNKAKGFALFIIPITEVKECSNFIDAIKTFYPIIIVNFMVIITIIFGMVYFRKNIMKPIDDINESSKAIINGNYNVKVVESNNIKQDEVHELTYNFELMRDELKNKIEIEKKMKKLHVEVISCISHDLKTPLSTIKAYGEGIRDGVTDDKEKQKKFAEIIVNKTSVMAKMIDDLLEHSKAELHKLEINKEKVRFDNYFSDLMVDVQLYLESRNFQFEYINELKPCTSLIDKDRITEVIFNLIENAVKYNDKDEKKVIIKSFMRYEYVCISIKDNGIGISNTDKEHIFEKFYRAEKSRSSKVSGSGLGLSICKYIIENHDGQIKVNSILGKYTEVVFTIKININDR